MPRFNNVQYCSMSTIVSRLIDCLMDYGYKKKKFGRSRDVFEKKKLRKEMVHSKPEDSVGMA